MCGLGLSGQDNKVICTGITHRDGAQPPTHTYLKHTRADISRTWQWSQKNFKTTNKILSYEFLSLQWQRKENRHWRRDAQYEFTAIQSNPMCVCVCFLAASTPASIYYDSLNLTFDPRAGAKQWSWLALKCSDKGKALGSEVRSKVCIPQPSYHWEPFLLS